MPSERLQKVLARAGIASRRKAEELISNGSVTVDDRRVTELGAKVDPRKQQVRVNGKLVQPEHFFYVLLHKPREVMCTTRDPEGRTTVSDYLQDVPVRVLPLGRLDFHTSGVLLLSNDGDFVSALTHPKQQSAKVYVAKVRGVVDDTQLQRWLEPIVVLGQKTRPAKVRRLRVEGDKTWLEITLQEGKNRQIHRLGEATGNTVLRLARISFAGLTHDGLRPGQWRYLSKEELQTLKDRYGVPHRVRPAPPLPEAASRRGGSLGQRRGPKRDKPEASTPRDAGKTSRDASRTNRDAKTGRDASKTNRDAGKTSRGRAQAPAGRRGKPR